MSMHVINSNIISNGLKVQDGESLYRMGSIIDCLITFGIIFVIFVLRSVIKNRIFVSLGKILQIKSKKRCRKFAHNMWFFAFYLLMSVWGLKLGVYHRIIFPLGGLLDNYPQIYFTAELKAFMLINLAFFGHCLFANLFLDERKTDYIQSIVHHCVTITLILGSFYLNARNTAITILVLHSYSDVILFFGKAVHCARIQTLTNIMFAALIVSFALTRLVYFPMVIYSLHCNFTSSLPRSLHTTFYVLSGFLYVLLCLHVFWFRLILIILQRTISAGKYEKDVRSDSEE
eukprot:169334_1